MLLNIIALMKVKFIGKLGYCFGGACMGLSLGNLSGDINEYNDISQLSPYEKRKIHMSYTCHLSLSQTFHGFCVSN